MSILSYCIRKVDKQCPFTFVDIGAMGGIPRKWDPLREHMRILAFEPDHREFAKLKSTQNLRYFNCLVYDRSQNLKFHVSRDAGRSSVFPSNLAELTQFPRVERFHTVKTVEIKAHQVKSMDEVVRDNVISDIDFMKVDTEGTELAIFHGSQEEVLPKVFGLQVEVEFIEKCVGQPLFRDIDAFLSQQGFQIMDLRRQFWKRKNFNDYIGKGQLVFGDALYFKRLDAFAEGLSLLNPSQRPSKIYKAVLCCSVYRLFDYAVALVQQSLEKNFLAKEEAGSLISAIKAHAHCGQLPDFPGRERLYALCNRISEALRPQSFWGFSDSDRVIGNIKDF